MDSNHRPSGYEPDELPLLHAALAMAHGPSLPAVQPPVPSALPRFMTRFGMERGGATALRARHWLRGQCRVSGMGEPDQADPRQGFLQGSPRPCAPVASTPHGASSAGRLPSHLLGDLPAYSGECTH